MKVDAEAVPAVFIAPTSPVVRIDQNAQDQVLIMIVS